jgi:phage baseplate assembly protein W
MTQINNILGSGLAYPIKFDAGRLKTATGVDSVVSAIIMLLGTRKGVRFFNPDYGSHIQDMVFEPCNSMTGQVAAVFAREDILEWIPRVERITVEYRIQNEQSMIELIIKFVLRNSPYETVMVYPFYLESTQYQTDRIQPTYTTLT